MTRASNISVTAQNFGTRKPSCCICHSAYATYDSNRVSYVHRDGTTILFCYHHLLKMANVPGTWFEVLPSKIPRSFDVVKWLNSTRKKILNKPLLNGETEKTLGLITKFLDDTNLSAYIGNTSKFIAKGFVSSKYPKTNRSNHRSNHLPRH